jgi:hypothetical protein
MISGITWPVLAVAGQNNELQLYLYRVWPKIDSHQTHVYLSILTEPIGPDYILRHFGSVRYLFVLKERDGKRSRLLRKYTDSFDNEAFPPRVNEAQVLPDPVNDPYFAVRAKKAKANADAAKPPEGEPAKKDDIAEIIRAAREGNKIEPHIIEWIQDFANHRDDLAAKLAEASAKNQSLDYGALSAAIKASLPPPPAPVPQIDPLAFAKAVKDLQPDQMAILAQAKQLFAPAHPAVDGLAQFREVFGFARDLLGETSGGGGRRTGLDVSLDIIKEGGHQVLQPVLTFINNMMWLKNQGTGAAQPTPSTAAPTVPRSF